MNRKIPTRKAVLWVLSTSVFLCLCSWAIAGEPLFESGPKRTLLLELYTSEGCSSCPPADRWLGQLKDDGGLWTRFVPVALHVDYWDRLGWEDRLASGLFSKRQRAYARSWQSDTVYTPGFVLDGMEWSGWRSGSSVPEETSAVGGGLLKVFKRASGRFELSYSPEEKEHSGWMGHVALLGMDITTDVRSGENRGRSLHHHFAAWAYQESHLEARDGVYTAIFSPESFSDAVPGRRGLAVWVTRKGEVRPVQSTGGYLNQNDLGPIGKRVN